MLRALVLVLVLANVAFLGWTRGWWAPTWPAPRQADSEPQRLAAQVRPELIAVLPAPAASAAIAAARAASQAGCLEAGPVAAADLAAAEAALAAAGIATGTWARAAASGGVWLRFASTDAELRDRLDILAGATMGEGFKPCDIGR